MIFVHVPTYDVYSKTHMGSVIIRFIFGDCFIIIYLCLYILCIMLYCNIMLYFYHYVRVVYVFPKATKKVLSIKTTYYNVYTNKLYINVIIT